MAEYASGQNPFAKSGGSAWQIPKEVQAARDNDRLAILRQELVDNPDDPALRREYELAAGSAAPVTVKYQSGQNPFASASPTVEEPAPKARIPYQRLTLAEKAATHADKILREMLPEGVQQAVVDFAGGAMEAGGLFKNAPRIKNTTNESTAKDIGRIADPLVNTAAILSGNAVAAAPRVAAIGNRVLRSAIPAAAAGAAGSVPGAASSLVEGDPMSAAGKVAGGTALGAVLGPTVEGVGHLFTTLTDTAQQGANKYLQRALGPRADEFIATLRALRGEVPGEQPTAGMAAVHGFPEAKALEEAARRSPLAHLFQQRDAANQTARENVLEVMAHPSRRYDEALSEAEALRRRATQPLYQQAGPQPVSIDEGLRGVLAGPAVAPVARRAGVTFEQQQANARGAGRPVPAGAQAGSPGAGAGEGPTRVIRNPDTGEEIGLGPAAPFMPQPATRTIQDLQKVKFELDKEISGLVGATDAASVARRRELVDARQQLMQQMEQSSGAFAVGNTVFRNLSAPQNQGQIADELLNSMVSATGVERPAMFQQAMRNAPLTLRRADQSPRFSRIEDVMSPEQMAQINALRRSLQREADYAGVKATQGVIEPLEPLLMKVEKDSPGWFSRISTLIRQTARKMGVRTREDIMRTVERAMLDPRAMADLTAGMNLTQRNQFLNVMRAAGNSPASRDAFVAQISNAVTEE